MTDVLTLPRLAGGRERAGRLAEQLDLDLTGVRVVLDCRHLLSAPSSFADELVSIILVERGAKALELRAAGDEFISYVVDSATDHGVVDRVEVAGRGT